MSDAAATAPQPSFAERVWHIVAAIPAGQVASYGDIAAQAGQPRHARQVGRILRQLPPGSQLPWHRVLCANGATPAGAAQRERLRAEGVTFQGERVRMSVHRWQP